MRRLTLPEVDRARREPGRSLLLFLTGDCPVGCSHCSVDARPGRAGATDLDLLSALLDGMCAQATVQVVGITGGEPFVARRALTLAVGRLAAAGKHLVVYTSGVWARAGTAPPDWVVAVLRAASCVVLSTDAYHEAALGSRRFTDAARAVVQAGVWLAVQVVDLPGMVERAEALLAGALGPGWRDLAELRGVTPLPYGRAAGRIPAPAPAPARRFGPCGLVRAPVVRADGVVTACCNEQVLTGAGPGRLRRRCTSPAELAAALAAFSADEALSVIGTLGPGALARHPRCGGLADREVSGICAACWAALEGVGRGQADPLVRALAVAGEERGR